MKLPVKWEDTQAVLIGCIPINMEELTKHLPQLIQADTQYRGEEGCYPLNFKEGILLTFFHLNSERLFTTIRKFSSDKINYYEKNIQEIFELIRQDDYVVKSK